MRKELRTLFQEIEATEAKLKHLKEKALKINPAEHSNEKNDDSSLTAEEKELYRLRLKEKELLIQQTQEFSKVGCWKYDFQTEELEWSSETYKIFDYPGKHVGSLNDFYKSCLDEKTATRLLNMSQILRTKPISKRMNQSITTPIGEEKILSFTSTPILSDTNEIVGVEGLVKDISDSITGKSGLDNFFDLSYDLHCIVHWDTYFVKISPSWVKVLGYSEKEILSSSFLDYVHPDDMDDTIAIMKEIDAEGSTTRFRNRYITKSGEVVHLSWNTHLDSETQLAYCTARDVTESKLAQDELLTNLGEKDLLLREIHHRVKNNLQIISSLLSLQSGSNSAEKHLAKLYQDSQNRIQSMASIHEMFYQSEELDKIEFGKYLDKLVGDLTRTFASKNIQIDFSMNITPIHVSLNTAIPLGLIINEVVTNSIKHGGDDKGNVEIFINMEILEDGKLQFTIGDKGINSQSNVLVQSNESLGVLLINSLVEQIDGEIEQLDGLEGTVFKLVFTN